MTISAGGQQEDRPVDRVRTGMSVVDANDEELGRVDDVKLGDPEAITAKGQTTSGGSDLLSLLAKAFGARREPDVPRTLAERLLRSGYLKVDSRRTFGRDFYVSAGNVRSVEGETVHLDATSQDLVSVR